MTVDQLIPSVEQGSRPSTPPPEYYRTVAIDQYQTGLVLDHWISAIKQNFGSKSRNGHPGELGAIFRLCSLIGSITSIGLYIVYPAITTIPLFVGFVIILVSWVSITWLRLLNDLIRRRKARWAVFASLSWRFIIAFGMATALVSWWAFISFSSQAVLDTPWLRGNGDKYFIAVNLHNNQAILPGFTQELTSLIYHLGRSDVYLSIYESNSSDNTPNLLRQFDRYLADSHIQHRILTDIDSNKPDAGWPYDTSPERIRFLAKARNKALEPLQSPNNSIRLPDWQKYTKVIFLNDIVFRWQDIIELIASRVEGENEDKGYDLACAMDFTASGFYDRWVARDICGIPFRSLWPYVKDKPTQKAIRNEGTFEVAACWNGAVVFDAKPILYTLNSTLSTSKSSISPRGWKAVDEVPSSKSWSRSSPPLSHPIQFRDSGIDACDHSECFLFAYDLHRLYKETEGGPRILMNPKVKVAYDKTWYQWNTVVLRHPIVKWWLDIWSHTIAFTLLDGPYEYLKGRQQDYCTWSGLKLPDRCPPLPGSSQRRWDQ